MKILRTISDVLCSVVEAVPDHMHLLTTTISKPLISRFSRNVAIGTDKASRFATVRVAKKIATTRQVKLLPVGHLSQNISKVPRVKGYLATNFYVQEHKAEKAGLHYDIRLHVGGKAVSWATRKVPTRLKGMKALFRQPDHSVEYSSFQGEVKEGYGKGSVKTWDKGAAVMSSETRGGKQGLRVRFYGDKLKGDYSLFQTKNGWGIIKHKRLSSIGTFSANKYTTKFDESIWNDPKLEATEKIDGSNYSALITKRGLSISSRRLSISGKPIYKQNNVPHLRDIRLPKRFASTVVQGELATGRNSGDLFIADYESTAGILNSKPHNAVQTQGRLGNIKFFLFEVARSPLLPRNATYAQRRALLEEIVREANHPDLRLPCRSGDNKEAFFNRIIRTRTKMPDGHVKRGEGIVLKNLNGDKRSMPFKWVKIKTSEDYDLAIAGFTPGEGRFEGKGIGALLVKDATGRMVGKVGSGLTDEVRIDAFNHPRRYLGKVVQVKCMQATDEGVSLRAPRLERFRPDKDLSALDTIKPATVGPTNRGSITEEEFLKRYIVANNPEVAGSEERVQNLMFAYKSSRGWKPKK